MTFQDPAQRQDQPPPGTIDPGPPGTVNPAALPPRPRAQNALFIPNSPNRDAGDWGTDWWANTAATNYPGPTRGPDMPSVPEGYSTLASAPAQIARWGSPDIAAQASQVSQNALSFAPLLDMISRGAFSGGFNAGSLAAIKRKQQQLLLDTDRLILDHGNLLREFGQVYNAYDAIGEKGEHSIDKEEAKQRLLDLARQHGWDALENIIEYHGIEAGRQFIKNQDALFRDTMSANTTLKKATGAEEEERVDQSYLTDSGGRSGTFAATGTSPFAAGRGGDPDAAQQTPSTPQTPSAGDFNANVAKQLHISPDGMQIVKDVVAGAPNAAYGHLPKGTARDRLDHAVDMTNAGIERIANSQDPKVEPADLSQQKLDAIRKISPEIAETIDGLRQYQLNPADEVAKGGNREHILALTKAVFPKYNRGFYANYHNDYEKQDSRLGSILRRQNSLPVAYENLNAAISQLPGGEAAKIPENELNKLGSEFWDGSPAYSRLNNALRAFAIEAIAAVGGNSSGNAPVSFVNQMLKHADVTASRAQLRIGARDEMIAAAASIESINRGFKKDSGLDRDAPGIHEDNTDFFSAVFRSNPYNGRFPKDAPPRLKITESTSKEKPSWFDPKKHGWEPLDKQTYSDALDFIQKSPNSPAAREWARQLGIMR